MFCVFYKYTVKILGSVIRYCPYNVFIQPLYVIESFHGRILNVLSLNITHTLFYEFNFEWFKVHYEIKFK